MTIIKWNEPNEQLHIQYVNNLANECFKERREAVGKYGEIYGGHPARHVRRDLANCINDLHMLEEFSIQMFALLARIYLECDCDNDFNHDLKEFIRTSSESFGVTEP